MTHASFRCTSLRALSETKGDVASSTVIWLQCHARKPFPHSFREICLKFKIQLRCLHSSGRKLVSMAQQSFTYHFLFYMLPQGAQDTDQLQILPCFSQIYILTSIFNLLLKETSFSRKLEKSTLFRYDPCKHLWDFGICNLCLFWSLYVFPR